MAKLDPRELRYDTNGAAAYNLYALPVQQPEEVTLPEEQLQPVRRRRIRVRANTGISLLAVMGVAAVALLLTLVIFGYVRLYESSTDVAALEKEVQTLMDQNAVLNASYESRIDLNAIELAATSQLGMHLPTAGQTVYLNLSGKTDSAEIFPVERSNPLATAWSALRDGLHDLVAYFT